MKIFSHKLLWIILAYCSLVGLNYSAHSGFYISGISFIVILFFLYMAWKEKWQMSAGLVISKRDIVVSLSGLIILTLINYYLITSITGKNNIVYIPRIVSGDKQLYFHTIFQTLNEEIMVGSVLLFSIRKKLSNLQPLFISIIVAAVFSMAHYFVYRYLFSIGNGTLDISALISLFAVGIIRNNFILSFNHIAYSWMLHLSWNWIFFGGNYYSNAHKLIEADLCNLVYGNTYFIIVTVLLMIVSSAVFLHERKKPIIVCDQKE